MVDPVTCAKSVLTLHVSNRVGATMHVRKKESNEYNDDETESKENKEEREIVSCKY